jgi:hypothetical protein
VGVNSGKPPGVGEGPGVAVCVGVPVGVCVAVPSLMGVRVPVGVCVGLGVRVGVGVDVRVAVRVGVGLGVCVAVDVGVAVRVGVRVAVGVMVGVGRPGELYSYAPMSQMPMRAYPRWSVVRSTLFWSAHPNGLPASMAGLPVCKAWVKVLPPLLSKGPRFGLTPVILPKELPLMVQPAVFWIRL